MKLRRLNYDRSKEKMGKENITLILLRANVTLRHLSLLTLHEIKIKMLELVKKIN